MWTPREYLLSTCLRVRAKHSGRWGQLMKKTVCAALTLGLSCSTAATAVPNLATLTLQQQLLGQINLTTTLGNLTQTAASIDRSIQGRVIVGNNATFASGASVCTIRCSGNTSAPIDINSKTFGALTVFGNTSAPTISATGATSYLSIGSGAFDNEGTISGNYLLNSNGGSNERVLNVVSSAAGANVANATAIRTTQSTFAGGNYSYNVGAGVVTGNGPTPQVSLPFESVFPFFNDYASSLFDLSSTLAALTGAPTATPQFLPAGSTGIFNAQSDYRTILNGVTYNYGVIATTVADLTSTVGLLGINNNGNDATFVIVRGDGANFELPTLNNFGSSKIIFDFSDATTLRFGGNFNGTVLAPLANITQQNGVLDGSIVARSLNQGAGIYDLSLFNGKLIGLAGTPATAAAVPESASWALMLVGFGGIGAAMRRSRKAAVSFS